MIWDEARLVGWERARATTAHEEHATPVARSQSVSAYGTSPPPRPERREVRSRVDENSRLYVVGCLKAYFQKC